MKALNTTLTKMSNNIAKANEIRRDTVQEVISEAIAYGKANPEGFTTKRKAMAFYMKNELKDVTLDTYTKRSIKVANGILVDNYKMKKELLTLAKMEQLLKFKVDTVNALMGVKDNDQYIEAVNLLIKSAKVTKKTSAFSASKASKI